MKMIFLLASIVLLQSCAFKKKEPSIANRIFDLFEDYSKVIKETQVRKASDERPVLPQSYRVAVYFKEPEEKAKSPQKWKWTQEDKDKIMSSIQGKKTKVGKVFELIDLGSKEKDAKSLRTMAAQQGADALLMIQGLSEVDSDANGLALTYVALVPALFVNGNHVDGSFVTQALLWNVDEAYVHLGVQNEGDYSHNRPIAFRQIDRVINKSKEESLEGLTKKLQTEFSQI
jgi:hypothetical protein